MMQIELYPVRILWKLSQAPANVLKSLVRNHSNQFEMSGLHSLAEKSPRKKHALKST